MLDLELIERLQTQFNHAFSDLELLERAITHRSYLNEHADYKLGHNERLEFLGDAVLGMIAAAYLYHRFPTMAEGLMTRLRIWLVRTETLAEFARQLDLGAVLRMAKGEVDSGGRNRNTLLCNVFEAVIGALYLDSDMDTVQRFILPYFEPVLIDVLATQKDKDSKSLFQEWAQAVFSITPTYRTVASTPNDAEPSFTVEVILHERVVGWGSGRTKQAAEQEAAQHALKSARLGLLHHELAALIDPIGTADRESA